MSQTKANPDKKYRIIKDGERHEYDDRGEWKAIIWLLDEAGAEYESETVLL
jgi:hypothetical protein